MNRRRGNPNWGLPPAPIPAGPTEFENVVKRLKLTSECYVPEWLLQEWRMSVEVGYGNDAA
jgi:hypothetical protein